MWRKLLVAIKFPCGFYIKVQFSVALDKSLVHSVSHPYIIRDDSPKVRAMIRTT